MEYLENQLLGKKVAVGIANSFCVVYLIFAPIPNLIQIWRKTQKIKLLLLVILSWSAW